MARICVDRVLTRFAASHAPHLSMGRPTHGRFREWVDDLAATTGLRAKIVTLYNPIVSPGAEPASANSDSVEAARQRRAGV